MARMGSLIKTNFDGLYATSIGNGKQIPIDYMQSLEHDYQ